MAKAIYRTIVNGSPTLVHASEKNNTVKLRWFGPNYDKPEVLNLSNPEHEQRWKEVRSGVRFSINEVTALTNDALPFSAHELNVDKDSDKWSEVFERLRQLGDITSVNKDEAPIATGGVRSPIPQTRMRRFYEMMRMLNEADLQGHIAKYLTEKNRADRIQVIFKESEAHFTRFANTEEAFHNRMIPDWLGTYIDRVDHFAKCLVARLHPNADSGSVTVTGGPSIRVVDYELSLFRTTGGAKFEDGKPGTSSGNGGMDLLLQDSETLIPVVGEIKASTDRDLFLALIQALTYATELTTLNQLNRLKRHYATFDFQIVDRQCDILLIYDKRGKAPRLMDETKALATQLLTEPESPVARRVRRIAVVSVDLEAETGRALKYEWSTMTR